MEINVGQIGNVTVLSFVGNIDAFTGQEITERINESIFDGNIKLVADFAGVDFTSSAGLRVMLGAVKETRAKGGDFRLAAAQPGVMKVLKLSGFTSIIKTFDDVPAAVASYT
jgi:anti-sigma B factor antagonist